MTHMNDELLFSSTFTVHVAVYIEIFHEVKEFELLYKRTYMLPCFFLYLTISITNP